ncbi:hypothetical protein D3C71_1432140 [compost metagenome]
MFDGAGNHREDLIALAGRNQRAHLRQWIKAIAQSDLQDPLLQGLDKLIVNPVLNQQSGTGGTDLSGIEKHCVQRLIQRHFKVGVGEHDVRILSAQLQRHPLEIAGGRAHHFAASSGASGQRH